MSLRLLAVAVLTSVAAPAFAAWPNQPAVNLPVCNATGDQRVPDIVSDGAGGAYITWSDERSGLARVYAQHVLVSGIVDPGWPANGLTVCSVVSQQGNPHLVSDGAGGAIVSWEDTRSGSSWQVCANHLRSTGLDPAWPAAGRVLSNTPGPQNYSSAVSDGAGGAFVVWMDLRTYATSGVDLYAQHVLATGTLDPAWPATARGVCTAAGNIGTLQIANDGFGNLLAFWSDSRSGNWDLYASRVLASGVVDPAWPASGLAVTTAPGDQNPGTILPNGSGGMFIAWDDGSVGKVYAQQVLTNGSAAWPGGLLTNTGGGWQFGERLVTDGAGGAYLAWTDSRTGSYTLFGQHLLPTGVDPAWSALGTQLVFASGDRFLTMATSDNAGGSFLVWADYHTGAADIYATHLKAGLPDPTWPAGYGRSMSTAVGDQYPYTCVSDGAGGMLTAWQDPRAGQLDIYTQRVGRHGYLGTPEPEIASVTDVPNDQGGKVKVAWNASYLDTGSDPNLNIYELYRSVPPNVAQQALAHGARRLASAAEAPKDGERAILTTVSAGTTYFWEYVAGFTPIHYLPTYSFVATTTGDSIGGFNPTTAFMLVARSWDASFYWLSQPKSGYSVDNVAPLAPAPFTGTYMAGATHLHWDPNIESDLAGYRLYRGPSAGFVPSPANLVAAPSDTGYTDSGAPSFYKLTAIDRHGNESPVALLSPQGTVAVGDSPAALTFAAPYPNPARSDASFRFTLARPGPVQLTIVDAGGRLVRTLARGARDSGAHAVGWDLRNERGQAVAAGLYFARLETSEGLLHRRIVVSR
jgi:hypothetical protein